MSMQDLKLYWMAVPLHITLSQCFPAHRSLAFFLVVIIMGKQQKWQFKREKHLSTWLNTEMSFRTWLPCVHTCLSGHTLSISYSNLLYMGKCVRANEGRADLAHVWFISMFHCIWRWHAARATSIFSLVHSLAHSEAHMYQCAKEQNEWMQCE